MTADYTALKQAREEGYRDALLTLAIALKKIAPDLADEISARWKGEQTKKRITADDVTAEQRMEIRRILEEYRKDTDEQPRDEDVAIDAILCTIFD
jgi:hypothetical protein